MDAYQAQQGADSSFDLPPIVNPPPQVFGGEFDPTSPISFSGPLFNEDQTEQNGAGGDDSNDAKRRRIARVQLQNGLSALTIDADPSLPGL